MLLEAYTDSSQMDTYRIVWSLSGGSSVRCWVDSGSDCDILGASALPGSRTVTELFDKIQYCVLVIFEAIDYTVCE